MRLTLRTMLAYMDEILEPDDAEDIGRKIRESEFASDLMDKTRECVGRARLSAPPLSGRGIGIDPNTVAEYLDNTLSAERVPELEKVCLESDVHLSEVAACHQILTLVLGEPANVEDIARERLYGIPARVAASSAAPHSSPPPIPQVEAHVPPVIRRPKPEVPDYLREPRSSAMSVVLTLLIAAIIGAGVFFGAVPAGREKLAALFKTEEAEPAADSKAQGGKSANRNEEKGDSEPDAQNDARSQENSGRSSFVAPTDSGAAPDERRDGGAAAAPVEERREDQAEPRDEGAAERPAAELKPDNQPPVEPPTDRADAPPPGEADSALVEPIATEAGAAIAEKPIPMPPDEASGERPPAIDHAAVGRVLSDPQEILLRFDKGTSAWTRLPNKAILAGGDRLLALPNYRPTITLAAGVSIMAIGPASFAPDVSGDRGSEDIQIDYGRFQLMTLGRPTPRIGIRLGDRKGTVAFGDGESAVAIEARRVLPVGEDPEKATATLTADFYVNHGTIKWRDEGDVDETLRARSLLHLSVPPTPPEDGIDAPAWTNDPPSSERRLSFTFDRAIAEDRPVRLTLLELADHRQIEVRVPAIRSCGYIGQFEPLVVALSDPDLHQSWFFYIDALRDALSRGPDVAAEVRAAFESKRPDDAKSLYRMLWGYTADQLKQFAAGELVAYLDDDALAFRVLAIYNLKAISGTGMDLGYHPEHSKRQRASTVQMWKQRLKEGKIVPGGVRRSASKKAD